MKLRLLFLICFYSGLVWSQTVSFDSLLENGKKEFYKDFDEQDYLLSADYLEQAVSLNPGNAEAHYFLGYAYSRINSKHGENMIEEKLEFTLKASEQFEKVISLTPKYEGEEIVLDPYSKISSEWGSLAMTYLYKNIPDSALWAFQEGKRRGGFNDFILGINRSALDLCSTNGILISSGDNFTFSLWYLQAVENYRKDVTVVDIGLLNSLWYPKYLTDNLKVNFNISRSELDSVDYLQWPDSTFTVPVKDAPSFTWTVRPSYNDTHLLRGDRLLLDLILHNQFKREVYFTTGFDKKNQIGLDNHLKSLVIINKININNEDEVDYNKFKSIVRNLERSFKYLNVNSQDQSGMFNNIMIEMLLRIRNSLEKGDLEQAENTLEIMTGIKNKYPYSSQVVMDYYFKFHQYLNE